MTAGSLPLEWIDSPPALAAAAERWRTRPALALDTEFVRERTFYPRLGLVQIADDERVSLLDPLAVGDLTPLRDVLAAPTPVKVAHSCSEDLEVLYHALGSFPAPLFDTQIGAALAGDDASLSYQRLVQTELGVELGKGETRTDWLRRPLSDAQIHYAAQDALYLLPVYERLRARLQPQGRLAWVYEDVARLQDPGRFWPAPDEAFLRLGGIGGMNGRQLAAARRLAAWREAKARDRDLPRNFVLRQGALITLARRLPTRPEELAEIPDLPPRQAERLADTLLRLVRDAQHESPEARPRPVPRLPTSEGIKEVQAQLQGLVKRRAQGLGIPAPVLASRRDLKDLVLAAWEREPVPPPFDGWRWEVLGAEIQSLFTEARRRGQWPRPVPISPLATEETPR